MLKFYYIISIKNLRNLYPLVKDEEIEEEVKEPIYVRLDFSLLLFSYKY